MAGTVKRNFWKRFYIWSGICALAGILMDAPPGIVPGRESAATHPRNISSVRIWPGNSIRTPKHPGRGHSALRGSRDSRRPEVDWKQPVPPVETLIISQISSNVKRYYPLSQAIQGTEISILTGLERPVQLEIIGGGKYPLFQSSPALKDRCNDRPGRAGDAGFPGFNPHRP